MISMNGFTLGFFFPKQDFVRPAKPKEKLQQDLKDAPPRTLATAVAAENDSDRPAPLSLYAYRFF